MVETLITPPPVFAFCAAVIAIFWMFPENRIVEFIDSAGLTVSLWVYGILNFLTYQHFTISGDIWALFIIMTAFTLDSLIFRTNY